MVKDLRIINDTRLEYDDTPPLLSIVVPVYNTENYVLETLKSIVSNGFSQIELIIVDDGSTDNSIEKIKSWISKNTIPALFLSQINSGLSQARMTGISYAVGEYIGFCDSDDMIDMFTFLAMVNIARNRGCDLALCRSEVFDSSNYITHDFYDFDWWDDILNINSFLITNIEEQPKLFRLEPNANPRLIKRTFFLENNIQFPVGLHFEDLAPHVDELAKSKKILLLNRTGYYYRVNRIGKITDQISKKRFDIFNSAELVMIALKFNQVSPHGQAFALILVFRMIYWCGENTLNEDRYEFFKEACNFVKINVGADILEICLNQCSNEKEKIMISAFATSSINFLVAYSTRRLAAPLLATNILINPTFGKFLRRLVLRILKNRILGIFLKSK